MTTHRMVLVFLLSYLHSHLGQNSFAFPCMVGPNWGSTTPSQLQRLGWTMVPMYNFLFVLSDPLVTTPGNGQTHLHLTSSYWPSEWSTQNKININFIKQNIIKLFIADILNGCQVNCTMLKTQTCFGRCQRHRLLAIRKLINKLNFNLFINNLIGIIMTKYKSITISFDQTY